MKAFEDYAAARCLLINGLFSGMILAQQAIEKVLKAYLSISHSPGTKLIGKKGLRKGELGITDSHDLVAYARLVEDTFPELNLYILQDFQPMLQNLSYCFEGKYPDSKSPITSLTTAWLGDIDRLMVMLSVALPQESSLRWRNGIFQVSWPLVLVGQPDPPRSKWVREGNASFFSALELIQSIVLAGHSAEYPD